MHTSIIKYHHDKHELHGFLALKEEQRGLRPAVLVAHDWSGRNEFACDTAKQLAELGYVGFAMDLYGEAREGTTTEEKKALMNPLVTNRAFLKERLLVAFETIKKIPEADVNRIAIIGFCFGGLCALDLARSGADIKGAVSFHGLLGKPEYQSKEPIKAKILVLHGYDDPMVTPDQVITFCDEMTKAKADWQVQMYGHTQHAFANPLAHDTAMGTVYNEVAAKRAWHAMSYFLHGIFG